MRFRPFFAKLIVVFALVLVVIVTVCGSVIYVAGQNAVRQQQIEELGRLTAVVRPWLAAGTQGDVLDDATRVRLQDAGGLLDTRITVIAGDGRVVLDTRVELSGLNNHNDRPEVIDARRGEIGTSVRVSQSQQRQTVYVARLLDPNRTDGMVLRLSYDQDSWPRLGQSVWPVLLGSVLAALLAVAGLWLILQRRWIGPTYRLVRTAEQMAAGDWNARAEPEGADELQFLSTRLNLVASHAHKQLDDLKHQRTDLQALVDTLPDPILAAERDGTVILLNAPAAKLLALTPERALGQNIVSVVNDQAVLNLFDDARLSQIAEAARQVAQPEADPIALALEAGASLTREIRLNRNGQWLTFQAVAKQTTSGGVLLVLRDVTALASAVQMKTDFVANASHELRTPIAAIKIAFETLRDVFGDDAMQSERCMNVIDGHLRRLEEMLRDLLDLSRVENPNLKPQVKRIKTIDVVSHVRSALGPMARQKGVELHLAEGLGRDASIPHDFLGDERLLHLILKNLVENSVKFTPAGGSVTVSLRKGSGDADGSSDPASVPTVLLSVKDTGIGIPQEHLDRVFERFYQVDAARSGSAGRGTGLGLAIVKHAINALGGAVQLESTMGQGTTVTCALPQNHLEPSIIEDLA